MVGEVVGRAAAIGAVSDRDGEIRQRDAGVGRRDFRIVPLRDFTQENGRVNIARQVHGCRYARQIVGKNNAARRHRQQNDAAILDRRDFLVGHRRIAGAEIGQPTGERLDALAAAHGLVIDPHIGVLLAILGKPTAIKRSGKGCAGSIQRDRVCLGRKGGQHRCKRESEEVFHFKLKLIRTGHQPSNPKVPRHQIPGRLHPVILQPGGHRPIVLCRGEADPRLLRLCVNLETIWKLQEGFTGSPLT